MIKVYVRKQRNYPVDTRKIKRHLRRVLEREGIVSDAQVEVAVVDEGKMLALAKEYLKEKGILHNVLSFTNSEIKSDFVYPPGDLLRLGQIVLCYPRVVAEAKKQNKLIDERALELIEHGAMHLLGKHHD